MCDGAGRESRSGAPEDQRRPLYEDERWKCRGQIVDVHALQVMEEIDEVVRQFPQEDQEPQIQEQMDKVDVGDTHERASERILKRVENEEQASERMLEQIENEEQESQRILEHRECVRSR